jgi:hypothetical protein
MGYAGSSWAAKNGCGENGRATAAGVKVEYSADMGKAIKKC